MLENSNPEKKINEGKITGGLLMLFKSKFYSLALVSIEYCLCSESYTTTWNMFVGFHSLACFLFFFSFSFQRYDSKNQSRSFFLSEKLIENNSEVIHPLR